MKGIKTAVKTDWKNYVIGDSRGPIRIDKTSVYFKGFNVGDYLFISYHAKWKGVDWGNFKNFASNFQLTAACGYEYAGFSTDSSEGEMDVIRKPFKLWDASSQYGAKLTDTTSNYIYSHVSEGKIKVADDGYIEITNIMVGKGTVVQPYIDSDKLKAEGGAISKALIVALSLSEERRAA